MKRFKSAGQAQRFLSAHDGINNLFHRTWPVPHASTCPLPIKLTVPLPEINQFSAEKSVGYVIA